MLQSEIHTGEQGAKRQSWYPSNPRALLKGLIDDNPKASEATLKRMLKEVLLQEQDYLDAVVDYWFGNNLRSIVAEEPAPKRPRPAAAAKIVNDVKKNVIAHIERSTKLALLDLVLPNGKKLRNATGADCKGLAPKIGVWLGQVARKLQPSQTVGKVLSEKEVREIYDAA